MIQLVIIRSLQPIPSEECAVTDAASKQIFTATPAIERTTIAGCTRKSVLRSTPGCPERQPTTATSRKTTLGRVCHWLRLRDLNLVGLGISFCCPFFFAAVIWLRKGIHNYSSRILSPRNFCPIRCLFLPAFPFCFFMLIFLISWKTLENHSNAKRKKWPVPQQVRPR